MIRSSCCLLVLALLAACERPTRTSTEEFLRLVPEIVSRAEADARKAAPEGSAEGPLLVDPRSFRYWAQRQLGLDVDTTRVLQAIGQPVEPVTLENAVQCANFMLGPSCAVQNDGVFVRLSLLQTDPKEIRAYTVSVVTHSNYLPPAVCERRLELVFAKQERGWALTEQNPKREC